MRVLLESEQLGNNARTPAGSRFEQPDVAPPVKKRAFCAQLGSRLQNLFPPMTESSAPEHVRVLLQRIQEIFPGPHGPGAK